MTDWEMKGKPALIILHMQQGILGKRGNIPGLHEAVHRSGILPRQQALLAAFRAKGLSVIYVRALNVTSADNPCGVLPAYGQLCQIMEQAQDTPDKLEIIPEVAPRPGEPVLSNWMIGRRTRATHV